MSKASQTASRRAHNLRKNVAEVFVLNVKNVSTGEVYFSRAAIMDVSATGLLLKICRDDILALTLRSTLTWAALSNVGVGFTIEIMDTYIEGVVTRTKPEGKGEFLVAIDFREDAPEYWRNCLVDLLPDDSETD
jgi:hypothetical protein